MRALRRSMLLAAVILAVVVQQASALGLPGVPAPGLDSAPGQAKKLPILLGTTGACNNASSGGPCTETSTLVQLDPQTGALIKTIGPVGYTVNGLAWDPTSGILYATTSIGDTKFHGLITIDPKNGTGKPVNQNVINFGLGAPDAPIHSITVDVFGHMVGWNDQFPPAGVTDSYVRIDQKTGIATEFTDTGINTSGNGLSFGEFNLLWNIDTPRRKVPSDPITQTAYVINPFNGTLFSSKSLSPPTFAALGGFKPGTNLYYGLNFTAFVPSGKTSIVVIDLTYGTVNTLGQTVDHLHTLAFIP